MALAEVLFWFEEAKARGRLSQIVQYPLRPNIL